jgi:WD repeat-containing protein 48
MSLAEHDILANGVLFQVYDRLDRISTSSRAESIRSSVDGNHPHSPSRPPEELYELLCNETTLPLGMTLAAVRQYVWKSSAELVLVYRRKKKPS